MSKQERQKNLQTFHWHRLKQINAPQFLHYCHLQTRFSISTLEAEPAFFHSPFSLMLFSVGGFCSKILALAGFGYFSVEHVQSFDNKKIP